MLEKIFKFKKYKYNKFYIKNTQWDTSGLAKEFEEIYFYKKSKPIILKEKSQELRLIQYIRDEYHRFAITFHRKLRSKIFFLK